MHDLARYILRPSPGIFDRRTDTSMDTLAIAASHANASAQNLIYIYVYGMLFGNPKRRSKITCCHAAGSAMMRFLSYPTAATLMVRTMYT